MPKAKNKTVKLGRYHATVSNSRGCLGFRVVSAVIPIAVSDLIFNLGPEPLNPPLECDCGQQCPCGRAEEESAELNP